MIEKSFSTEEPCAALPSPSLDKEIVPSGPNKQT
jgi:hypothetical protein